MDVKKQLTIVMKQTVQYANEQSKKSVKEAVQFVDWVNGYKLDILDDYLILRDV